MSTEDRSAQARFGTFGGVFTPCCLTILGVIMFMRSGYVVGDGGLWQALVILLIAKSITTLTTLSLSAIATNTEVRTGGVYYMISRTLGPDFGGAIGLTLFFAQAVSIAFYVIGFSEALFGLLPDGISWLNPFVSTAVILLIFFVTFKGTDVAIRAQYPILAVLLLSVAAFIVGGLLEFDSSTLSDNMGPRESGADFWVLFAIFFPAATGITAGANMSGDLKDPAKSIPNGTLIAIGFTALIYLTQLVLLSGFIDRGIMADSDPAALDALSFQNLKDMSGVAVLIVAGVFAATLSSALGSFLGAPRILQAMGKDRLLSVLVFFGKGHGPADEPRVATVLSLGIAIGVVWLGAAAGGLNFVAQIISMFFLIAYGMINLSAFVEGRGGNPSFRPRFRLFGWPAALVGAIGCGIAMVKIDETYAIISMLIAAVIYFSLRGRVGGEWGDAKRGYIFSRTRQNLLTLETMSPDPKNWRPVLMVLTEDAERDRLLIQCASWLESGRGLLSVLEVASHGDASLNDRLGVRQQHIDKLRQRLHDGRIVAFADSVIVPDARERLDAIIQAYSIGSLRPNTVMMSIPPPPASERRERVASMLATVSAFDLSVVLYKGARVDAARKRRIDVWWHGQRNGSLLALFAYLVQSHPEWTKAEIRMLRMVKTSQEHAEAEASLTEMMAAARLAVHVEVVLSQRPVSELIAERSGTADLVLLGLRRDDVADLRSFLTSRDELLTKLPPTLLVWSNGDADLMA
ncbi:MAG: amino acid permease [Proteobacteria bacterium]|nr:amino acid permease [Pseudomonadota bacterium]